jgi:formylglycine-generating enzyme required for sulfatase activity
MMNASDALSILPPPFEWCEIPAGRVTLEDKVGTTFEVQPFLMAKYPITYAQFQVFIDAKDGFHNPKWWEGLAAGEDHKKWPGVQHVQVGNHPRDTVSWYDAVAFCRWLSKKLGCEVRLPTEWEWQWAAQGGDGRRYPWGNRLAKSKCNTKESGIGKTTPVDKYPSGASPFGVMDMAGNVWEWCLNEYSNPENIDLTGRASRVTRGGSCYYYQYIARCVNRRDSANYREHFYGFRVVCARSPST